MAALWSSISGVLEVLIIILVGFGLAKRGWFDKKTSRLIAKLVTQVALPAAMISTITKNFTADILLRTLPDLRFPILSMAILFGLSIGVARILRIKKDERGLFESMFLNSNTIFIGLPINMALFGVPSLPYVLVYYMANTTIFWTLGVYLIQRDGDQGNHLSAADVAKKVFSPPLLGFMLGVVLVLLHISLPAFLTKSLTDLGNMTVPLSMIFIGIAISRTKLSDIRFSRKIMGVLAGRFLVAPLLMAALVLPTGMPILMKQVFIMQAAMPVMTNAPVVSQLYGADDRYAAVAVAETTSLSLIFVPILMFLVQHI
ncbi:AEC family transporter [Eupransor demetentiae]|uniref:AEC (Auxin efflux carrier) family (YfdV) n=1 Tax=Eupransor demetentiae TaxID=3109584 RepID=A0ABP0ERF0_9LACO|nr:AEC (auxin efflux carrier) family (YfdV) [Lactobacillaceae bacterium LMG 33000]